MCGITVLLSAAAHAEPSAGSFRRSLRQIRHRGPDFSGVWYSTDGRVAVGHERLAVVRPQTGEQPLFSSDQGKRFALCVNGEIYNFAELGKESAVQRPLATDCDAIMAVWEAETRVDPDGDALKRLASVCKRLDGVFAFCIIDSMTHEMYVARDRLGICPLYIGVGAGVIMVSSELKGMTHPGLERIEQFPPAHCLRIRYGAGEASLVHLAKHVLTEAPAASSGLDPVLWPYHRYWSLPEAASPPSSSRLSAADLASESDAFQHHADALHDLLVSAIHKRLQVCDVPFGVLLSGGLDSSIMAAVAARYVAQGGQHKRFGDKLRTFSVGLAGSPDLAAARRVADHIGSEHHELVFTFQQAWHLLHDVVRHIETYDPTTIRSSVPMSLLIRMVKAFGIKMVLSGEGSDELLGGYLYFHRCPSEDEFQAEAARKLAQLYQYDVARANKVGAMWGTEIRVAFLDPDVLEHVHSQIPARFKLPRPRSDLAQQPGHRIEKCLLRQAFQQYLPQAELWRQKEQFSDGVGHGWIDQLRDLADSKISDQRFAQRASVYPFQTPQDKEAMMYRDIFEDAFAQDIPAVASGAASQSVVFTQASMACSTAAALRWCAVKGEAVDPSGRSVASVYASAADDSDDVVRDHEASH